VLEGFVFHCGSGMDRKCITSKEKLLECVGTKFSASEKLTLEEGRRCPVGVKDPQDTSTEGCKIVLTIQQQKQWDIHLKKHTEA